MKIEFTNEDIKKIQRICRAEIDRFLILSYTEFSKLTEKDIHEEQSK